MLFEMTTSSAAVPRRWNFSPVIYPNEDISGIQSAKIQAVQ
jgi:hypothetical protein